MIVVSKAKAATNYTTICQGSRQKKNQGADCNALENSKDLMLK